MNNTTRQLSIVTGLSGAGKTVVLNTLEDLSYYTIDNLPISLLDSLVEQICQSDSKFKGKIAVGIDARNSLDDLSRLSDIVTALRERDLKIELVYIDAENEVLTRRFSETRRKHPLSSEAQSLDDAIKRERSIMSEFVESADIRIDTSYMLLHELRDIVRERIAQKALASLSIQIMSFGFKHGIPSDADFVFDVRCLPNPYWKKHLRQFVGNEQPIIDFLSNQESVKKMLDDLLRFFSEWVPQFEADNRSYLSIAIGCTGGHHRSVYLVEQLANKFKADNKQVIIRHRDI